MCEIRLVIEKHKNKYNINSKIKYFLYNFSKSRVSLQSQSLRELEVSESSDEVLSDIIVFDKNQSIENYVIVA